MLFKVDKNLSSILIAKGDKPAQKLAYEELSTTEKLNSDFTAVGLSDVYTRWNKNKELNNKSDLKKKKKRLQHSISFEIS